MARFRTCPYCGSSLDPGERCDCQDKEEAAPVDRPEAAKEYETTSSITNR